MRLLILGIVFGFVTTLFESYVVVSIWGWFFIPYGFEPLPFWLAFGAITLAVFFNGSLGREAAEIVKERKERKAQTKDNKFVSSFLEVQINLAFMTLVVWFFAWLVHFAI